LFSWLLLLLLRAEISSDYLKIFAPHYTLDDKPAARAIWSACLSRRNHRHCRSSSHQARCTHDVSGGRRESAVNRKRPKGRYDPSRNVAHKAQKRRFAIVRLSTVLIRVPRLCTDSTPGKGASQTVQAACCRSPSPCEACNVPGCTAIPCAHSQLRPDVWCKMTMQLVPPPTTRHVYCLRVHVHNQMNASLSRLKMLTSYHLPPCSHEQKQGTPSTFRG